MLLPSNRSMAAQHVRNLTLVTLSFILLPMSACITSLAWATSILGFGRAPSTIPITRSGKQVRVLVTGIGMAKGLFLCRSFYLGGCHVVGLDFRKNASIPCGRFSRSVSRYYALPDPENVGTAAYLAGVVRIVNEEDIDLCVTCSGVSTALADAKLVRILEESTNCKVFQLNEEAVEILDDKYAFMKETDRLALQNPVFYSLRSTKDVLGIVSQLANAAEKDGHSKQFIVKNVSMDDASRGAIPLLDPTRTEEMASILMSLHFDEDTVWILQEYFPGNDEYCTHAVVVKGVVRAFTACPSASVLLHYRLLDPRSRKYQDMLRFTKRYANGLQHKYEDFTGHLSFDFLSHRGSLMPIECNPRCHTATVLFRGRELELTRAYLSLLNDSESSDSLVEAEASNTRSYYWIGHDLVALMIAPVLSFDPLKPISTLVEMASQQMNCIRHVITWKDPTFEWWDPTPWFALYHVYWPLELVKASLGGIRWKELNVSTTKMFKF